MNDDATLMAAHKQLVSKLKWPGTKEEKILREISFLMNYGGLSTLQIEECHSKIRILTYPWSKNDEAGSKLYSAYLISGKQKWD